MNDLYAKCKICNKKTQKVTSICRCSSQINGFTYYYCPSHIHKHDCTYDYKNNIKINLIKVEPKKILQI